MSIKSDRWIRRMAAAHGMIEPFSAEQVRSADGHKIVSYGTSSYGYDVRCAPEFKIFTNINSTIVDPKNFDEKSFVDFSGPVCIIPPNSFALARTVEFFRIPRSVLVVCLGKCVTGDTRVVDADTGAYVPITDMRWGRSTLAFDSSRLRAAKVSAFVPQGKKEVFELRTRAGLRIRATANHPFLKLNGWAPLSELLPGDRIAAARDAPIFGKTAIAQWESTLLGMMVSEGLCDTQANPPAYATADPVMVRLLEKCVAVSCLGTVTCSWLQRHGLNVGAGEKFVPRTVFTAPEHSVRLFLQASFSGGGSVSRSDAGVILEYCAKSRRLIEDVHHLLLRFGIFSLIRDAICASGTRACKIQIKEMDQIRRFAEKIGFVPGSVQDQQLQGAIPAEQSRLLWGSAAGAGSMSVNDLDIRTAVGQSLPLHAVPQMARVAGDLPNADGVVEGPYWDVVEQIEPAGVEDVFDISVPTLHNFLANGLIVHNSTYARCGIICNVTPLEPEWEGHVTLEFSNTTPLPAKIYANEGVAQMLFFESDEVCATSYKDRGGKYQGQRGVTLPKT